MAKGLEIGEMQILFYLHKYQTLESYTQLRLKVNYQSGIKKNQHEMVEKITLVKGKENKKKFLQVKLTNGEELNLKNEDYFLLIHAPNQETGDEDYVLVFNMPEMLGEGAHYQVFLSDAESGNAIGLFWLLKEFIPLDEGGTMAS